jgi:hypothetical protein
MHRSQRAEPVYQGRPVADWVREALDAEHWVATTNARYVVHAQLREQAVPFIVRELKTYCYPRYYLTLYRWQFNLPRELWLLPEPKKPGGRIQAAAHTLAQMGEPARPAMPTLARCLNQSEMRFSELLEVMWEFVGMGPEASGALPILRTLAADSEHCMSVQAALAIYSIEGTTDALAPSVGQKLSQPGQFGSFNRELWWFREDERVNSVVLPLLCKAAADPILPMSERNRIVHHLGEVITSNSLPAATLHNLLASRDGPEIRESAQEALDSLSESGGAESRYQEP